jgi:photosystem II stability/assembly factor-like uncharacterized protein
MKAGIYLWVINLVCFLAGAVPVAADWEVAEDCADTSNLRGVAFATPEKGMAFGEGGEKLIFSVDGGNTWQPAKVDIDYPKEKTGFFDGLFSDGLIGWVVGSYDTGNPPGQRVAYLLKTSDGGATWVNQPLPDFVTYGNPFRVWFDKAGNGWLLPYHGHGIFRTTDGGKAWQQLIFREAHPAVKANPGWLHLGFHVFDADHLMVCGQFGLLLETADGGETWSALETGQVDSAGVGLTDASFVDEKHGWVVGEKGLILHTADGGKTWEKQASGVTNDLERVQFVNERVGYAVGSAVYQGSAHARFNGVLLYTEDGGKTWKNINPTSASLLGLCVLDAQHAWAVGGRGGSGSEPKVMIIRYGERT